MKKAENYVSYIPDIDPDSTAAGNLNQWYLELAACIEDPTVSIAERREFFEHWGDYSREPGDVDYTDTSIADVRCLWAAPHGCDESRVLI